MSRIAAIALQTNGATQDTTAAVSYLAELAEQLRASVATFRLPEQGAQGQALLSQPDGIYPQQADLPYLDGAQWGGDLNRVPALPGVAANSPSQSGGFSPSGFDLGSFDTGVYQGLYEGQQASAPYPLVPSIAEQPSEQQSREAPFSGDLY
jgi:hypothetical protein